MKKFILYITVCVLVSSCAARKVNVDKVDTLVKTDSTSVTKQETVTTQDNNVSVTTNTDELEIIPIDTTKSIEVDGKKYKNVKLRYKKTKNVLVDNTKIKVAEKVLIKANVKKAASVKVFKKEIDKKGQLLNLFVVAFNTIAYCIGIIHLQKNQSNFILKFISLYN